MSKFVYKPLLKMMLNPDALSLSEIIQKVGNWCGHTNSPAISLGEGGWWRTLKNVRMAVVLCCYL